MQSMTLNQVQDVLPALFTAKNPVFFWGGTGAAKSTTMHLFVDEKRKVDPNFGLIDLRASQLDPVDVRGMPYVNIEKQESSWLPFDVFPNEERDGKFGLLLLEELNSAIPAVLASLYELLFDRRIGKYKLPDGWAVWALGNRDQDNGVTYQVPGPVANRFANHILVNPTVDDFCNHGFKVGCRLEVMAFLRWRPELMMNYDPKNPELTFGSMRTWTYVSDLMKSWESQGKSFKDDLFLSLIQNCVGDGAGVEFIGFLDYFKKLPDLDDLIKDPENAPIYDVKDAHLNWAIICGLFNKADGKNAGQVIKYAMRLPAEFSVVLMRDCTREIPEFTECPEYVEWSSMHSRTIL